MRILIPKYPRIHDVCKEKLFAILRTKEFFCRKCQVRVTVWDGEGNRVGPGVNPIITDEQIKAIVRSVTSVSPIKKVVYKLVARPSPELEHESS